MTNKERAEALSAICEQLFDLCTKEEIKTYPFMVHLLDLVNDLEMEE
jgi:hypothetical protein